MVTRLIFTGILAALAVQRIAELRVSRRNEAGILARGGCEHAAGHYPVMQALHTLWFLAALLEVFLLRRPFVPALALAGLLILAAGQALRYAAILSLKNRWTVRVMTVPGEAPVKEGIYRYIRHPNYLGVILEIAAVPMLHTAFITAILFSIANALLLAVRIPLEEQALRVNNDKDGTLESRPRFLPRPGGREL